MLHIHPRSSATSTITVISFTSHNPPPFTIINTAITTKDKAIPTMAITEIAKLSLVPSAAAALSTKGSGPMPFSAASTAVSLFPKILSKLSKASGRPFLLYQSVQVPSEFFLVGHWDDRDHHQAWLENDENKELLEDVKGKIEIVEMVHVDVSLDTLPLGAGSDGTGRVWLGRRGTPVAGAPASSGDEKDPGGWHKVVEKEEWVKWVNDEGWRGEDAVWRETVRWGA